ncbi:DnaA N-terminal domain-containing protein [Butyrivibrio sp. AE3004]|uniref:DnaA N-terminal domain-containing protein n=1 Tax=Butyrivibrio sp. AE3004 TaxID=1506994 RepID=UPI000493B8EF|nr:DnaA N-terminal domain-containing protein [Butyrivibrio sp. AE3004]
MNKEIWHKIKKDLKKFMNMTEIGYTTWIKPLEFQNYENGTLTLILSEQDYNMAHYIEQHYGSAIKKLASIYAGKSVLLQIVTMGEDTRKKQVDSKERSESITVKPSDENEFPCKRKIETWELEQCRSDTRISECKRIILESSILASEAFSLYENKELQSANYKTCNLIINSIQKDMIFALSDLLMTNVCYQDAETMINAITEIEDSINFYDKAYTAQNRTFKITYKIGMVCMNQLPVIGGLQF